MVQVKLLLIRTFKKKPTYIVYKSEKFPGNIDFPATKLLSVLNIIPYPIISQK